MSPDATLFDPVTLGGLRLANRLVMAPLTRSRAHRNGVCGPSAALYYAQRASAGLVVTDGVCISPQAVGHPGVPGIWTEEHVTAWRRVTDGVHLRGGLIVLQLWHTGRGSHPTLQPSGELPVAPSAIAIDGFAFTLHGLVPHVTPRALKGGEIPGIVDDYARAADNALRAGFDGVEIHGANGYLIDQFLQDSSNQRTDRYGGTVENRSRFLFDVVAAVSRTCGADRVGLRLSPSSEYQDMHDSDPRALFGHVLEGLSGAGLAYIHLVEPGISGSQNVEHGPDALDSAWAREHWPGRLIVAGDYDQRRGEAALARGSADAVAYGRLFLANPDLPSRFRVGAAAHQAYRPTFYGGTDEGYIDYPSLEAERILGDLRRHIAAGEPHVVPEVAPLNSGTPVDAWPLAWAVDRLRSEGVVAAEETTGTLPDALDARAVFQLGVAWLSTGRIGPAEAGRLRELLAAMLPHIRGGRFVDRERYLEANEAYHEFLVGLAGDGPLLGAFRALELRTQLAEALSASASANDDVLRFHEEITEGMIGGDFARARDAILAYAELAKSRVRGERCTPTSAAAVANAVNGTQAQPLPTPEQLVETSPDDESDAAAAMLSALEARALIEIGVTQLLAGSRDSIDPQRLLERADELGALTRGGRYVDVARYLAANAAFHDLYVGQLANPALLRAFRRLDVPNLMVRAITRDTPADRGVVEDHRRQAQALAEGDFEAACRAIADYRARCREILEPRIAVARAPRAQGGRNAVAVKR
jgi:N-ethylmaleimide reductase